MIISLTGFMGCGKSSVGRKLSSLLSCSYADLDTIVEENAGRSIPEIFETDGEVVFREMELESLRRLLTSYQENCGRDLILSLGGGTVMTPKCAELVHEHTLCIYLRASAYTLVNHLESESENRPLLSTAATGSKTLHQRITELMSVRAYTYEKTAHIIIDTDGKEINYIAEEILSGL